MDTILYITYLYLLVLLLAVLIERIMEILMSAWRYIELKTHLERFWTRRATRLARYLEIHISRRWLERFLDFKEIRERFRNALLESKTGHSIYVFILDANLIRQITVTAAARVVASVLGVAFCVAAGIDLVELFSKDLGYMFYEHIPRWLRYAASGLIIGLGSEPVHRLIQTVERRRKRRARKIQQEKLQPS
jgi:hypothetical protein